MTHVFKPIFQAESKLSTFTAAEGHLEDLGPRGEQHTRGAGQGVVHFFKYAKWGGMK